MSSFIAYHVVADTQYVLDSDPAKYPRRSDAEQAAQDVWDAWHKPTSGYHAQHLVIYRLDGEIVRPLSLNVRRKLEVR